VALEVLEGGMLTTVQDLGRHGYQRYGVPVAGAMDPFALRAANALVGNSLGEAALEITIGGPTLRTTASCLIAVTGADLSLRVNGHPLPSWMAVFVRRGWIIEFDERRRGCRAYLAVAGGIDVPPIMGSKSTYLRGGFGGLLSISPVWQARSSHQSTSLTTVTRQRCTSSSGLRMTISPRRG
jgi:antagonist of KipI